LLPGADPRGRYDVPDLAIEAEKRKQREFFELAERFRQASAFSS
jgi:hypothetical protein